MFLGACFSFPSLLSSQFEVLPHLLWRVFAVALFGKLNLREARAAMAASILRLCSSGAIEMMGTPVSAVDGCGSSFVSIVFLLQELHLYVLPSHWMQTMTKITKRCDAPHG